MGRHAPQSPPAPHADVTASTLEAPEAVVPPSICSQTARHRHTIMRHSATIRPVVSLLKSSKNGYVPGLSARIRTFTVLPAGTTFSVRRSLLSNSAALSPLLVMTRTKGALAFTLISSGANLPFSIRTAISGGSAANAPPVATAHAIATSTSRSRRLIASPRYLGHVLARY